MAIYKVPQDVEAEDKLLGPFTFRQFIYLLIVAAMGFLAFVLWQILPILAIIPAPIILFFAALALPLRKDQPMETYLAAIISFYVKPRKRLWDPDGVESRVEISAPKVVEVSLSKDLSEDEAERRFSYLAQIVDSKGWATRGAMSLHGPEISNGLNPDMYFEANSSIDILSDEYSIGQSIDQRLEQSAIQRKQDVLKNIQSPTQYPAITEQPVDKLVYPNIQDNYTVPALETPLINTVEKPIGNVVISPFPTMNQAVLSPTSTTQTSIDINKTIVKEVETENKDIQNTISADIIELATNAPEDFSIATLASQAKRISEEKNNLGEDEVIISLR